ncbi:hypothetical protein GCM10023205_45450 [Yinghuangia aomiensis]|uniref:Secreted protein n=1 Tax=Yinghuangia aomiensis TaxID=676205 RepID=A0ABP9HMM8_9ACTN
MIPVVLVIVLAAVVFGCVCVVWASRGGPPRVRAVARATTAASGLSRDAARRRRRGNRRNGTSGSD